MKIIGFAEVFAVVAVAVVGCGGASSTKAELAVVYPIAARHLVVDDSTIYFTSSDGVMLTPKEGGGSPVRLGDWSSFDRTLQLLAVDDVSLYWRNDTQLWIWRKTDGALTQVDLGAGFLIGPLVADGDSIYLADESCLRLGRLPKDGTVPTWTVVNLPGLYAAGGVTALATDANNVYCSNNDHVIAQSKATGEIRILAVVPNPEEDTAAGVVSDGSIVYFANDREVLGTHMENLMSVDLAPGGTISDVGLLGNQVGQLGLDAARRRIYWTTAGGVRDTVAFLPLDTKQITTIASDLEILGGAAQDATHVYFANRDAIMRVAK